MLTFDDEISEFLISYVHFPKAAYKANGNLREVWLKVGVKFLLDGKVFQSREEMKAEALKDFNVILPDSIFR